MKPLAVVAGPAIPLMLDNVDTDLIIRIERLSMYGRDALGPFAFEVLRRSLDGLPIPGCILDDARFLGAPILLAGRNFGCGSSREGAVWALQALGLKCVIAESFGDIFQGNCFQNGLLPVRLPRSELETLVAQAASGKPVCVDLVQSHVILPDGSTRVFFVDPLRRAALLAGLDDIQITLGRRSLIDAWQSGDRATRPWIWQPVALPSDGVDGREAPEGLLADAMPSPGKPNHAHPAGAAGRDVDRA